MITITLTSGEIICISVLTLFQIIMLFIIIFFKRKIYNYIFKIDKEKLLKKIKENDKIID